MLFKLSTTYWDCSERPLSSEAVFENALVWFIVSELRSATVPPYSTQEDLTPLLSPWLSISPDSFISAVVSLPHTVKTPKPRTGKRKFRLPITKGLKLG